MSSTRVIELLCQITEQHFPGCEMLGVPMGDGGEGTVDALIQSLGGHYCRLSVTGPLGQPVQAAYGVLNDRTAIVEMAQASGITLVPRDRLDVKKASSYGTGEMLKEVIQQGYRTIYLLLGGSATNDGGMGAAAALGIRFLDKEGNPVEPSGAGLAKVASVDTSRVLPEFGTTQLVVMCDVTNPLLGENGATYVYGKQKGATPEDQKQLEKGMENYADVLEKACGKSLRNLEGAGAAGGFVLPFLAFGNVQIQSGIKTVLRLMDFDRLLEGVDLVVTGEGRLDGQSIQGKVLSGIGEACQKKNIPAVAIVGGIANGGTEIFRKGIQSVVSCVNNVMTLEEAISRSEELFLQAADRMYRFVKIGLMLQK